MKVVVCQTEQVPLKVTRVTSETTVSIFRECNIYGETA